jgi:hypothetical protein
VQVPADNALSEKVLFELPNQVGAERLCEQLRLRRLVGVCDCGDIVLVAAEFRSEEGDLAALLRSVARWAVDSVVPALRFHLDGRAYVLEPDPASSRAAAA